VSYDGYRVKTASDPQVYVVIDNQKCYIPNPGTYNNLFENWNDIQTLTPAELNGIPTGTPLTSGSVLAKGTFAPVYLITNGQKRHVKSQETMDKYDFAWNKIVSTPDVILDSIPDGSDII